MKNKNPIAVLITDTHLTKKNGDYVFSIFQQAIDVSEKIGCKTVVHLGDHFVDRASQELETVLSFQRIIDLFKSKKIFLKTFPGNHDKSDQTLNTSWLSIFKGKNEFVDIYEEHHCLQISQGIMFHFLPYYKDELYQEILNTIPIETEFKNVLFTHQGISGVLDNDGVKVANSINKQCFSVFDKVFIGHYHNHSKIDENIQFIGSTDPRNYGENSDKGCVVLYDDLSIERIQFKFKKFITVKFEESDIINLDKKIKSIESEGNNVRIVVSGDRIELAKIDKSKLNSMGFEVVLQDTELSNINVDSGDSISLKSDRKELRKDFINYCESKGIDKSEFVKILKKI